MFESFDKRGKEYETMISKIYWKLWTEKVSIGVVFPHVFQRAVNLPLLVGQNLDTCTRTSFLDLNVDLVIHNSNTNSWKYGLSSSLTSLTIALSRKWHYNNTLDIIIAPFDFRIDLHHEVYKWMCITFMLTNTVIVSRSEWLNFFLKKKWCITISSVIVRILCCNHSSHAGLFFFKQICYIISKRWYFQHT